ncbi:MAG: SDR family NAD(P)-dependent oxidoreductase [Phormidium sp. SL48-SHIP]|nr:MAG: SDR family NAD(P)-dependent oxidoreductase [Phormidium sp. SL48-SHIP]
MTQFKDAAIVLTGAAGGFGQQFTRKLLKAGGQLILADLDEARLRQQAEAIQQEVKTGNVLACLGVDLSDPAGSQSLYDAVNALGVPVDILINNAGIGLYGRMDEVPTDKWERLMQVNLLAPMRLSTLFVADMIQRRQGHIVNISSLAGWIAVAGMAHYASSKFGLRGFSEGLFNEVKPYNVKVTAVYPYFSRTPLLQAEKYGSLAQETTGIPDKDATDPERVIEAVIRAIAQDKLHVFPDRKAQVFHQIKRYFPPIITWGVDYFKPKQNAKP